MSRSKLIVILVYVAMILLLATSTVIVTPVYGSWWFFSAWALLALLLICVIVKTRMWRRLPSMILHCSFLLMLAGGAVTYFVGEKGYVALRQGESTSKFTYEDNSRQVLMPITMTLDSFVVAHHPGSMIPRDYISYLKIDGVRHVVSMNNIVEVKGYRIYQSSFDDSGCSLLSINHDPVGIALTYGGYAAFGVAGLMLLFSPSGRFRRYLRRASAIGLVLMFATPVDAASIKGIPIEDAETMREKQVLYNGRVAPFNTLARDFVLKITGESEFAGLSPEQVVASWVLYPDDWKNQPFILVESEVLRECLGFKSQYVSFSQLFTSRGEYRLRALYEGGDGELDQEILKVDEKVELIYMLLNGELIKPLPADAQPLSRNRVKAEIFYNTVPFAKIFFMAALTMALLMLGVVIWKKRCHPVMVVTTLALLAFQLLGYGLRWYISRSVPLSNGPETMQFLSIVLMIMALILYRRNIYLLPLSLLLAGFFGLVSYIGDSNPVITPLVPVLDSPWLSIHVSVIMTSYALLAITMLVSVIGLSVKSEAQRLLWLNSALLYPAVILLGAGIFIGAVWANVSWGRYWGWDPKEVWALITMLIYALPLHSSKIAWFNEPRRFHWFMVGAFLSVLFTYFGVNYLLGGLHSYA